MATLAIGDIHGNLAALDDLLEQVGSAAGGEDTVVFLGDYIDRGPDAKGCVERILRFQRETPSRVICLCGNHEEWMLHTWEDFRRHSWLLGMQPLDTIRSYSAAAADTLVAAIVEAGIAIILEKPPLPYNLFFDAMPEAHRTFFRQLADYHETPDCVCVHGGLDTDVNALDEQTARDFHWGGDAFPERYRGTKPVVYGHRNNAVIDAGWPHPRIIGATIGIDTISHGVLTAVRLPDRTVFQSQRHKLEDGD